MVSGTRYVELLTADELEAVVARLAGVQQDSFQRRSVRAAERKVYTDDYDEEELEVEDERDANEEELAYHVTEPEFDCATASCIRADG